MALGEKPQECCARWTARGISAKSVTRFYDQGVKCDYELCHCDCGPFEVLPF